MKIRYTKKALSFGEQLEQLKSRGLVVEDEKRAIHYLTHINYYRLSAYLYPFLEDKNKHIFKANTTFNIILDIYNFDRELRLLLLDAIERIEISFRTNIIYILSHKHGPFWICNKEIFYNEKQYFRDFQRLKNEISRSDEKFLKHYFAKYSEVIPPAWISLETASLGLLSLFYKNLKSTRDLKEISNKYGHTYKVFRSWFHSLTYLRNLCAHHSRIWNRELAIQPLKPKSYSCIWLNDSDRISNDRIFIMIAIIIYFLSIISPTSHFKKKLVKLFEKYPMIDLAPMGFPRNWREEQLFKI
jgi:abortive infection bacteriophage resistance protein